MLVVLSSTFTLAFGADFTFWISDLGLSQCHSSLTPFSFFRSHSIIPDAAPLRENVPDTFLIPFWLNRRQKLSLTPFSLRPLLFVLT